MDKATLRSIGTMICDALAGIAAFETRKQLTKAIYETLKTNTAIRDAVAQEFGGPIKCRYAGCEEVEKEGVKHRKVLGYLWDFSFSRFAIPQAIGQEGSIPEPQRYEILLLVESELGRNDEICRDLLKLLEARTAIRCLIYKQPRVARREQLQSRFIRVLHNHAHFRPRADNWLFIGLSWAPGVVHADVYTLGGNASRLIHVHGI
jgi:hypothetical protein